MTGIEEGHFFRFLCPEACWYDEQPMQIEGKTRTALVLYNKLHEPIVWIIRVNGTRIYTS